jgi:twitching motility protein PilI
VLINSDVTTQVAVMIGSLVGLRSVEAMRKKPPSKNKDTFLSKYSFEDDDKNVWYELDVGSLTKDKAFVQPTIV